MNNSRSPRSTTSTLLACAIWLAALPIHAAPNETDRRVTNIENLFERLRSHADFLGFRYNQQIAPPAWGSPGATDTHYQGIARSAAPGRPYLFVTRSGMEDGDRGRLLVVRMGSRNTTGERMRSNRYEKDDSVEGTQPPAADTVVDAYTFTQYHHPGGIQLCGDILAVPLEGVIGSGAAGKVDFFDVSDPEHIRRLPVTLSLSSKVGIVGLTRLPDGHFLLVTTGGSGATLGFWRSNRESFFDPDFAFSHHDSVEGSEVIDGIWHTGTTSHQALQLMVSRNDSGNESVYLVAGRNDADTAPYITGNDFLYLYKITGWEAGESKVRVREIGKRHLHTDSGNLFNNELDSERNQSSSYQTDSNGNFLAGLGTYVSPTGEFLVYAVEHYNWGPRGSVRFSEFRHEQVYREGNPIYDKQPALHAPDSITEDSSALLDAGDSLRLGSVRPWVEIFEDANYNGRSVIMDWADRSMEDFKDLRKLAWPEGFNDKASSVRWFAPYGWRIRLFDGDNYKVSDSEPYLDLEGLGHQAGIRVLSEAPYEFDNVTYDGTVRETRVTSMKFIPPGYPESIDVFTDALDVGDDPGHDDADDGWSNPKGHLKYRWRLLDENLDPVPASAATLTPVEGSPWLATLKTFTRTIERLNVELTVGPFPEAKIIRPIAYLKRNRTPSIVSVSREIQDGNVKLTVQVKDDDTGDLVDLLVTWDADPRIERIRGKAGQRIFTASRKFTNPDPEHLLRSEYVLRLQAEDSAQATSAVVEEPFRIDWRSNRLPVVGPESFTRATVSTFKTRIRTLLANDSDPDGDYFEFAGVRAVYPEGATVTERDGWLLYTPPPGGGHLPGGFDYAIRDQYGGLGSGRATITPQETSPAPNLNLLRVRPRAEGGVTARFQGFPGQSYEIEARSLLFSPWTRIGRVTADATGQFEVDDPSAGTVRMYRTKLVSP